ncbi:MAG: DUF222 domain-containing protein [Gammaproteobacteria bacterium]
MDGSLDTRKPTVDLASYTRQQHAFEQLETKITELWGHLNAATFRFLALVAEFDRTKCYERHGLVNTAQWLNWQCGIGTVAAREKVRVARSLESLPQISAVFARGEVSYSKVRAMTRVATAANESVLVSVALHGTAAHVEKLVRKYRWVERAEAATRAQVRHENRALHYFFDDAGMLVVHGRLPPEVGAVVRKALDVAVEALRTSERDGADASAESSSAFEREQTAAAFRADALAHVAEHFLEHRGGDDAGSTADRFQVVVHVDQTVLMQAVAADDCAPHCCELDDGPALALDTARRLSCDATLVGIAQTPSGEPLDVGRRTRAIPPALARALRSRDGGCRFPGCTRTRFTEGHHVKHWADGGETRLGNLATLCRFHHRLVHEGGFNLKVTDDGVFVFTRPDGTRVAENGEQCFRGSVVAREPDASFEETLRIHVLNLEAGLAIDAKTSRSRWLGESMDYSQAIEGMQFLRDRDAAERLVLR